MPSLADDTGAYTNMQISPWQIPEVKTDTNHSLDGAGTWSRDGAFPRDWGAGLWKMLKMNSESKSKRLKAHEYLIIFVTGMFSALAAWPRDDDITNTFAASMGVLTAIIRKLVSHSVKPKVGIDLYLEMLHEELQKVETQALPHVSLPEVQLKCPAEDLPVLTKPQELEELTLRITEAGKQGTEGLTALLTELEEKHGGVCPPHALGMIRNEGIRQLGSELGIHLVEIRNKDVLFHSEMSEDAFEMITEALPTNIRSGLVYHPGKRSKPRLHEIDGT
eukprot:gene708-1170_t